MSNDYWHSLWHQDYELLEGLSFFSKKYAVDGKQEHVIPEGRGINWTSIQTYKPSTVELETQEEFNDLTIYLNAKGQLVNGCDWSYENQEKHIICDLEKLEELYDSLEEI